jgi:hypothetical protein
MFGWMLGFVLFQQYLIFFAFSGIIVATPTYWPCTIFVTLNISFSEDVHDRSGSLRNN